MRSKRSVVLRRLRPRFFTGAFSSLYSSVSTSKSRIFRLLCSIISASLYNSKKASKNDPRFGLLRRLPISPVTALSLTICFSNGIGCTTVTQFEIKSDGSFFLRTLNEAVCTSKTPLSFFTSTMLFPTLDSCFEASGSIKYFITECIFFSDRVPIPPDA